MRKATSKDLLSLKYGDVIHLKNTSYITSFRYVGRMPSSENYLILSNGENLKHIYIEDNGTFKGDWFIGEYDEKFIIKLRIEELKVELLILQKELDNAQS